VHVRADLRDDGLGNGRRDPGDGYEIHARDACRWARIIAGLTAGALATCNAYVADVTPPERRAQGFGLLGAAFGLGFAIGPAIGGFLGGINLRLPFFLAAGCVGFNWLYGVWVLPESLPLANRRDSLELGSALWEMIARLRTHGDVTLFLTTHYMEEADQLCDRVAIFDHGRIVAEGSPAALKAQVAATETIEVEFVAAGPGWSDALRQLPGVGALELRRDACRIESADRVATVGALVEVAHRSGVTITSLVMRGKTLEDVFIRFTGRDLRDAADQKRRLEIQHLYERRPSG
jgi:hypothetical protein